MTLSLDCVLIYILRHSGVVGRLASGRIEICDAEGLRVYDGIGRLNEYLSGDRLRSWRVIRYGSAVPDWSHVMPEDLPLLETHW